MSKQKLGMVQMLLCAALWSIAGVVFKYIPWNSFVIAGGRGLITGIFVFGFIKAKKMPIIINRRAIATGIAMCLTCTCFVAANKMTTAANAIVLQFTTPIFILLYSSLFRHKRFRRADVVAVLLTLGSMALFFLDQLDSGYILGNLVAIGAGCAMAGMYITLGDGNIAERYSGILICQVLITLLGIPFAFTTEVELTLRPVLLLAALGVFQLGIPYLLLSNATENCPPLACSLLGALEPLLNPVWVVLIYGEVPGMWALIGGAAVIATVTGWCIWSERHPELPPEKSKEEKLVGN